MRAISDGGLVEIGNAEGKPLAKMATDSNGYGRVGILNSNGVWESL